MNIGAPPEREFLTARQYYELLKRQVSDLEGSIGTPPANTPGQANKFLNAYDATTGLFTLAQPTFANLSGTPTTVGGYGITDFNSLGDARWQALDQDLTSLAGLTFTNAWPYRSAPNTWSQVLLGPGLALTSGTLRVIHSFAQAEWLPKSDSITAGATLNLAGLERPLIEVTGNTNITSITGLADGEEVSLFFTGTPTIVAGGSLLTLGGADIIIPSGGGLAKVMGGAASVSILSFNDSGDYSKQTFDNIFMNEGGNIRLGLLFGDAFDIGRVDDPGALGNYLHIQSSNPIQLRNQPGMPNPAGRLWLDTFFLTGTRTLYPPQSRWFYRHARRRRNPHQQEAGRPNEQRLCENQRG